MEFDLTSSVPTYATMGTPQRQQTLLPQKATDTLPHQELIYAFASMNNAEEVILISIYTREWL